MSQNETQVVEGESVKVIHTEALTVGGRADLVASGQTDRGIALFEERVRNAKRMLSAALKLVAPSQIMVYGEGDKRSVYFTAGAADRVLRHGFGMRWGEKTVTVAKDDHAIVVTATADLLNPDGSIYERFIGTRRAEYRDDGELRGYLKDEQGLIKGALANLRHRAVHEVLGVNFLSPADLRELGLDMDKLQRKVEFQDHASTAKTEAGAVVMPYGKNTKGKTPAELDDGQLRWHLEAAEKSVNDPEKAKWRAANERLRDALAAEQARRSAGPSTGDDLPLWADDEPGAQ